ncbi:MAG: hypothetical protein PQJ61_14300 [Spirochaetales bacterium]|uniref:TNase-like domain-containing protein n=1 Tax=Candidatus Thalassospirochaeta sargassi TaxID=3119039 RepID=A0AAJ1IHC1_9SPIO|nr:hypothetical protein [Spirochaetales bacterium]
MKNKKFNRIVTAVIAALVMLTVFSSCDTGFFSWDIEVWGTWEGDNSALGVDNTFITITNSTITFDNPESWDWDYAGEIVEWNDDSYNLESENPTEGDFGYLIYKVTSHADSSYVDTYSLVRWNSLTTVDGVTTMLYSECAYKLATLEEAQEASGAGAWYSSVTLSE